MKFNLIIILSVLQFCKIIVCSESVNKNGYCNISETDTEILDCHKFTMTDINEFTFQKINSNKIHNKIKYLNILDSNIDFFTRKFFGYFYGSLEHIKADNCGIFNIYDETFTNIPNLTHLELPSNSIKKLRSKTFYNLKKLRLLDLNRNLIEIIEPDTFENLTRLEYIFLDENKLKFIMSNTFNTIINIEGLYLRNNPINGELILNINKIERFSAYKCGLTKFSMRVNSGILKYMNLESNKLKEIILGELRVEDLYLSNNQIKRLDKIDGSELKLLALDGNPLDYDNIQNDFVDMTKLDYLSLINTNLHQLNKDMFKSLNNLAYLRVDRNPLQQKEAIKAIKKIPNLINCQVV